MSRPGNRLLAPLAVALAVALAAAAARAEPDADAIRAARDAVYARPEFRYPDATEEPSLLQRFLGWVQEAVGEFQQRHPLLFLAGVGVAVLALVAILAHLLWTWRTARRARYLRDDPRDLEAALRRLDPAPFRAAALAHADAGRWEEAVRELYTALLLTLDRRGAVRYAAHKALLDYRIEAARDAGALAVLDRFADAYPPGSFGRRPPRADRFRELVAALDGLAAPGRAGGAA